MNKRDMHLLYEYNRGGNARILGAASTLTAQQFRAPRLFPHGGLRDTLVHALFAEWACACAGREHRRVSLSLEAGRVSNRRRVARALDGRRRSADGIRRATDG
jgi:uncharacterized damage-inducible protein DinB